MSKNKENHIVNMIIRIVFIVLGISQVIFCTSVSNLSSYDLFSIYPTSLFRTKRNYDNTEYTRWRGNEETTNEFIVKVLDEDIITPHSKKVVAINIEPKANSGENIIVGGVVVPRRSYTSTSASESFKDYTRFVPPTTGAVTNVGGVVHINHAPFPKLADNSAPILSRVGHDRSLNSQRDDSPPASPQFLARTPRAQARQYAPIAQVAFTQRSTYSPTTPAFMEPSMLRKMFASPYRTTSFVDIAIPTRTSSSSREIYPFVQDVVANVDELFTRTNLIQSRLPGRTSIEKFEYTTLNLPPIPVPQKVESDTTKRKQEAEITNVDMSYNIPFYGHEENDSIGKKDDLAIEDIYFDTRELGAKNIIQTELVINTTEARHNAYKLTTFNENQIYNYESITEKEVVKAYSPVSSNVNISRQTTTERLRDKRRQTCSMLKLRQLNFNSPLTLPEIVAQLKQWSEESPVAKWIDITDGNFTTMENPIYMMIVDDPTNGQSFSSKQTVMIVAGIQGRDHHAVAAAMYVLYHLIERSEAHVELLTKYRFWIIPVFNPDGYDYSMKFPHRRQWMKNLRQTWDLYNGRESCNTCKVSGLRCSVQHCYGVNLDRNFEYQWIPAEELSTETSCGELYAGTRQLSEPETRALTHYLHEQRTTLFAFIALKEGDVLGILYPYSHTKKKRAFDHIYRQRALRAASAAFIINGRPYIAGQTSEFLPLYAGGIEDWVDGHLGIDNTYTIMMFRPSDTYNSKLITEIIVHEAYAAIDTLLLQSVEPLAPQLTVETKSNKALILIPNRILAFFSICIYKLFV